MSITDILLHLLPPDFEALKRVKIINIEEIRWYAVELYNMKADESKKIKGYKILTTPLPKNASKKLTKQH